MIESLTTLDRMTSDWTGLRAGGSDSKRLLSYGTSYRTKGIRTTLRRVWPLRVRMGVTRVADITELDYLRIPVVTAVRASVHAEQITSCQGKGIRFVDALVSALQEVVERHSAARFNATRLASIPLLNQTGDAYIDPVRLGARSIGAQPIEWVEGLSLRTGRKTWLPAADVLFPYTPPAGVKRPVRPSTTGLASGNSLSEAALHACFEVFERDAVSRYLAGGPCSLLNLDSITGSEERSLVDRFRRSKIKLLVVDLSECCLLPTYKAFSVGTGDHEAHLFVTGQGTHIHPAIALRRALTETAQARAVAIQGSREDLIRHQADWREDYDSIVNRFQFIENHARMNGVIDFKVRPGVLITDARTALRALCELLDKAGYQEVVCTELTDPEIGIPTIHVCIPGMVDNIVDPNRTAYVQE